MHLKLSILIFSIFFHSCASTEEIPKKEINTNLIQADKLTNDGLYREAIAKYSKSTKLFPKDVRAHRTLAILLVKTGQYKKSLKYFKVAQKFYENDFELNYYFGEALRLTEKYDDAIFRYKLALNIRNKDERTLKALAWTYYKIGYYTATLTTARKLRKINPKDFNHSIIAARALMRLNKPKTALKVIQKAKPYTKKEHLPYLLSVEAECYLDLAKLDKAEQTYRLVLKEQPLLPSALLGLGKTILYKKGNKKIALEYIERSYRLRPKMIEAKYILAIELRDFDKKKAKYFQKSYNRQYKKDPIISKRETRSFRQFVKINSKNKTR